MNRFRRRMGAAPSPNVSRRDFLRGAGAILVGAAAMVLAGCDQPPAGDLPEGVPVPLTPEPGRRAGAGRPNFLFILTDDHRWDHLGVQNHPFLETPHLDRLAQEGVLFENAFVTTALCSPSRASFLTGQYARRHGVQNNLTPWRDQTVTFFEALATAGYRNSFIGKWHMPGRLPNLRGLEQFITFTIQGGQGRYFDCPLVINGVETRRPDTYVTTDLTDYAIDFIQQPRDDPFCLYLSHKAAHHNFLPPPDLDQLYDDADLSFLPEEYFSLQTLLDANLWEGTVGPLEKHYRNYCETLAGVDREVGRLLDALESAGQLENTVIVYAGDNGYSWGEHVVNGKRWATEENMRIPFIVRDPRARNGAGRRRPEMVLNVDLAPTLFELAGLLVPEEMQGLSLRPLLTGEAPTAWRDAFVYEYFQDFPYNVLAHSALRTEQYLYIEYEKGRPAELYDIIADPRTLTDISLTETGQDVIPMLRQRLLSEKEGLS